MQQIIPQRIAICFSGSPRTWKKCISSLHNILKCRDIDTVDVFCHIWDFNTIRNGATPNGNSPKVKVTPNELNELIAALNPKKFLIESAREFTPMSSDQELRVSSWMSQAYGIMRAARLKREYEIKNNFQYDVVVRARYDSLYHDNISNSYVNILDDTMHGFHFGWDNQKHIGRMGDICWFADSDTYDLIADYYLNMHTISNKWYNNKAMPETVFFHYIKKNNIRIQNNHWYIQLFRESADNAFSKNKDSYETW
jgi:hypothetical protein